MDFFKKTVLTVLNYVLLNLSVWMVISFSQFLQTSVGLNVYYLMNIYVDFTLNITGLLYAIILFALKV